MDRDKLKSIGLLIDEKDADLLESNWFINKIRDRKYLRSCSRKNRRYLHREVLTRKLGRAIMPKMVADHINGNPLDNRRINLRECTNSQNLSNRGKEKGNTSGFVGVWPCKQTGLWGAELTHNGKRMWLGRFKNKYAAAAVRNACSVTLRGEFHHSLQK